MEKEGLVRSMDFLIKKNKIKVKAMVTDRHSQIKKYMKSTWKGIQHWFDVWHVAKGKSVIKKVRIQITGTGTYKVYQILIISFHSSGIPDFSQGTKNRLNFFIDPYEAMPENA